MHVDGPESAGLAERLIELLEPFRYLRHGDIDDDHDAYSRLLPIGVIAWNLAVLPEPSRSLMLERFMDGVAGAERPATQELLEAVIARRLELFDDDRRFIRQADVVRRGEDFELIVSSVMRR